MSMIITKTIIPRRTVSVRNIISTVSSATFLKKYLIIVSFGFVAPQLLPEAGKKVIRHHLQVHKAFSHSIC